MASNLVFIVLKYISHLSSITFSLRIFFLFLVCILSRTTSRFPHCLIFARFKFQAFNAVSVSAVLALEHSVFLTFKDFLAVFAFPSFSNIASRFRVLLPLRVPLFFSFVIGALEIATFSPEPCFGHCVGHFHSFP